MPNLPVIVLECRDCASRQVELLPRTRLVWCQHCGNVWIVPTEAALQPMATIRQPDAPTAAHPRP
jgi:uncharacterized Zn finger protein